MLPREGSPIKNREWYSLRRDSFGWLGQFFQSIAHMAPAAGVILNNQFTASRSGFALPLASALAMLLAILLAYCLGTLTRKYYGASGYFQIHSKALGSTVGFLTSWLFFLYEPLNASMVFLGFGVLVLEPFSAAHLGVKIPWWVGLIVGNVIITLLALSEVKRSIRVVAVFCIFEFLIILTLGIVLVSTKESTPVNPFSLPASSEGIGGLMFASVFSFLAFVGYESGLPLTEETRKPKVSTFKGLLLSVLLIGTFYVFMAYATVIGFGAEDSAQFAHAFSTSKDPYGEVLARKVFGTIGPWLVFFAILNSTFGCALAGQNAIARVFYSLGRAGVLPSFLGRVSAHRRVPMNSVLFASALTFISAIVLATVAQSDNLMNWYGFTSVLMTLPLLIIHLMTCLSVFVAFRFRESKQFSALKHGLIPFVTGVLTLVPIWGAIYYNSQPPFSYAPWCVLIWFSLGIMVCIYLKRYKPTGLERLELEFELFSERKGKEG